MESSRLSKQEFLNSEETLRGIIYCSLFTSLGATKNSLHISSIQKPPDDRYVPRSIPNGTLGYSDRLFGNLTVTPGHNYCLLGTEISSRNFSADEVTK